MKAVVHSKRTPKKHIRCGRAKQDLTKIKKGG